MKFFKFDDELDLPLDDRDLPLDEMDIPLSLQIQSELNLDNKFSITDDEYDDISSDITNEIETGNTTDSDDMSDDELDQPLNFQDDQSEVDDMDADLNDDTALDTPEEETAEDPNFQGIIRTVKGANLVYKRQMPDGTYTELWLFNIGNDLKQESITKRAILAGTDIEPSSAEQSQDGKQNMETWSAGNVQFLSLTGIPS